MVRSVDPDGEALVWCRKCSGYAQWCVGTKLMNRCIPEKKDTKEHGKMLKNVLELGQGDVPDRNAERWKVEGKKGRVTKKWCKRLTK